VTAGFRLSTARLTLTPVGGHDLAELIRLKADPLVYALMLGGVRGSLQVIDELTQDIADWGANGIGMFAIREGQRFHGITGIQTRPDGRGQALRFALYADARGRGLAREAASAALHHAHYVARIPRIVAVARADNFGSRMILGAIGMTECDAFLRDGHIMHVHESRASNLEAPPA